MAHNHIDSHIVSTCTHELLSILLDTTIQLLIRWPSSWMKPTTSSTAALKPKPRRLVQEVSAFFAKGEVAFFERSGAEQRGGVNKDWERGRIAVAALKLLRFVGLGLRPGIVAN